MKKLIALFKDGSLAFEAIYVGLEGWKIIKSNHEKMIVNKLIDFDVLFDLTQAKQIKLKMKPC